MSKAPAPVPISPSILAVILAFTLASALGTNAYMYGAGDNSITIPFVKAFVDPALYPGDYLIAQRSYYYTYLWDAIGLLHARLGISLPALFFGTYLLALYLTFLGVYRIALSLFASREVAILALLFLLFTKETVASVMTIEHRLNTRAVATPLLLFAIHDFLERKIPRSFLWMGVAYLVHPLTAHYVMAMLFVAALVESRRSGFRQLVTGLSVFLVVASPLLVWRIRHTPPSFHMFSADPQWLAALHLRSAHHMFPFDWGWAALVHPLVVLVLFGIAWRHRNPDREDRNRVIWIATLTILALCVVGILGSEILPVGMVLLSQPPRSFQFMEYFALLYVAHDFYRRVAGSRRLVTTLGAVAIAGWIFFDAKHRAVALVAIVAMAAIMVARRLAWRKELTGAAFVTAATCVAGLSAWGGYARDRSALKPTFTIAGDLSSPWIDVENWARTHTDVRDGFIVPPEEEEEFRVHGERTVYGDVEDGGLMNANPEFGREWHRRMRMLGLAEPGGARRYFCELEVAQIRRIASEMIASRRVFIVWPCDQRVLPFPRAYRNDAYIVYEVSGPAGRTP